MEFEDNYEDELDRMRTRRQRRGGKRREDVFPLEAEDDDFVIYEDLEENSPHPVVEKKRKKKTGAIEKRRKKKKKGKFFLLLAVILCGLFLFRCVRDDGYWTIAIFGVDSRDGNLSKGALADVTMVCSINKKNGEMRLVSVFRDSYLKIDNKDTYHKINEAFFKGGYKQAVEALEQNLDLKIDDYAVFNWKAVVDGINVLGGIDLDITDREFAYINSFITETVKATGVGSYHLSQSGTNHLDGVQAVAYARLRLMDTDFNRTERQRKVLGLAMDKAKEADFATLKTLVGAVFPQVSTSIGVDDILSMAKNAKKYYIGQASGFPFSHAEMKIGKMDCVIPTTLASNVTQLHEFLYDKSGYTPSSTVQKISNYIAQKTGLGEPGKDIETDRINRPSGNGGGEDKPNKKPVEPEATQEAATAPSETEIESSQETAESEESLEESMDEEVTIAPLESSESAASTPETTEAPLKPSETLPSSTEASKETTGVLEGPGTGDGVSTEGVGPGV